MRRAIHEFNILQWKVARGVSLLQFVGPSITRRFCFHTRPQHPLTWALLRTPPSYLDDNLIATLIPPHHHESPPTPATPATHHTHTGILLMDMASYTWTSMLSDWFILHLPLTPQTLPLPELRGLRPGFSLQVIPILGPGILQTEPSSHRWLPSPSLVVMCRGRTSSSSSDHHRSRGHRDRRTSRRSRAPRRKSIRDFLSRLPLLPPILLRPAHIIKSWQSDDIYLDRNQE